MLNQLVSEKKKGNDKRNGFKIAEELKSRAIGIIRVNDVDRFKFITGFNQIQPVMKYQEELYILVRF